MIRHSPLRKKRDSTIPLINVVFLMLVFFLIAGTVAPPLDPTLNLVQTKDLEGREPPDALVLHVDGHVSFRGRAISPEQHVAKHGVGPIRIVPDRDVSAQRLMEVTGALRRAGATSIVLVTERALQ
ncbi:MAG: biopolymer transporter ExbD [Shimia sp.]|uniref:ExbD/TolR family protein n=1 Tax=Shimia sp. TaxID=1954381 RepID=UPI0019DD990D|nr:biopolymer transporter ExbD [Shimia sp.]MBE1291737.1 biopolymer transporter ExbD [Paracoccaceae bacterium]MBO6899028.1 biopolymer transporter ExbD [Shimia sp.]